MHTLAVVHHKGESVRPRSPPTSVTPLAAGPGAPKVLLIDLDPAASLTSAGRAHARHRDVGYAAAIDDHNVQAQVVRSEEWGSTYFQRARHARIERSSDPGTEQQLRLMLEHAPGRWDYAHRRPGLLGMLTTTALAAAASGGSSRPHPTTSLLNRSRRSSG